MSDPLEQLDEFRRWEIEYLAGRWISGDVLEVGAGDGAQAALLATLCVSVTALEVEPTSATHRQYQQNARYPLQIYDGNTFPFPSGSFDVVYSSYVLEHVADVQQILAESRRVLRPAGVVVAVVPTTGWRLWSIPAYYPARLREVVSLSRGDTLPGPPRRIRFSSFFPSVHGEEGSVAGELLRFARWRWRREFREAGLVVIHEAPMPWFASGEWLTSVSQDTRRRLSRVLGSTGRLVVARRSSGARSGKAAMMATAAASVNSTQSIRTQEVGRRAHLLRRSKARR